MSSVKYWIWLSQCRGLRPQSRRKLIECFDSPEQIYFASDKELSAVPGLNPSELRGLSVKDLDPVDRILDKCLRQGVNILTWQDAAYPQRLRNIYDPPMVLYIKGRLPAVDEEAAIGIVGTRKATPYGLKMALRLGHDLTRCGGLVVSGLAAGIDSAGAEGALRAGGSCIGVLGTAIDVVYPKSNRELFADVQSVGALVSEYPPGSETHSSNFPARNRIISGLSVGVLVIEAPKRSGALITADRALEQGRELFAVPGNADAYNCEGSNELLKDCAKAVTEAWDILSEFESLYPNKLFRPGEGDAGTPPVLERGYTEPEPEANPENGTDFVKVREPSVKKVIDKPGNVAYIDLEDQLSQLTEQQLKVIAVMEKPSMHVDDIIDLSGLPASVVLSELTMLELSGYITGEKGKRFSLNVQAKS